jgi:hypothetical protein
MTLSHLSRLGLDDDAVRCQWWMEMMTRKHQSLSLWRNRGSKACHWMAIRQRAIDVCTVAGNRPFAQRLAAWIALSLPRGYVARASWVEPAGFPIALLRREPRAGWVELAAGSIWNRFRDCVVRTRPFSRRQGNVHEALPGAVAHPPARPLFYLIAMLPGRRRCSSTTTPALESTGPDSPRRYPSDTESHRSRWESTGDTPCDPDQRIG